MSTQEPTTEAGKAIFDRRGEFTDSGDLLRAVLECESAARAEGIEQGAAQLLDVQTERDMAEAYYRTLETHLRQHGCDHDFALVANENGLLADPEPEGR